MFFQCPQPIINLPATPPNHEWLKVLVSAALGLLSGLALEPLKAFVNRRRTTRLILTSINADLRRRALIVTLAQKDGMMGDGFWGWFDIPAYKHFEETQRDLFYEVSELTRIGWECEDILHIVTEVKEGRWAKQTGLEALANRIDAALGNRSPMPVYREAVEEDAS